MLDSMFKSGGIWFKVIIGMGEMEKQSLRSVTAHVTFDLTNSLVRLLKNMDKG